MSPSLVLPAGARLLHVGPHKTGTTAIQSALHQAREDLAAQGVGYLSARQHDGLPGRWITGRLVAGTDPVVAERRWQRLVTAMTAPAAERRVFSSEFFSDATDAQAAAVVQALGREDLWIAITLRPLARILPSQYQQGVQRRSVRHYDEWLHAVLDDDPPTPPPGQFWLRHRHDELVRRWADQVGAAQVVVIVLDPADHAFLPRAFEQLLGLVPDTLAARDARENRSLTAPEIDLLRRFNEHVDALGLGAAEYARLLRPLQQHLKARVPGAEEPRLVTPDWAVERANRIGAAAARAIRAQGVPVLGDLDLLGAAPLSGASHTGAEPTTVDADLAAWFAAGLALSAPSTPASPQPAPPASTRASLGSRVRRRLGVTERRP